MLLLLAPLLAWAGDGPLRADRYGVSVGLAVVDGQPAAVAVSGTSNTGSITFNLVQDPEGFLDPDYQCAITWADATVGATALDTAAWPALWPGAAWRLDLGRPYQQDGSCDRVDPGWVGADVGTGLATMGWNIGLGPMTTSMTAACSWITPADTAVLYVWMDGGAPLPMVAVTALEVDGGAVSTTPLAGIGQATAVPDGWYRAVCGIPGPL